MLGSSLSLSRTSLRHKVSTKPRSFAASWKNNFKLASSQKRAFAFKPHDAVDLEKTFGEKPIHQIPKDTTTHGNMVKDPYMHDRHHNIWEIDAEGTQRYSVDGPIRFPTENFKKYKAEGTMEQRMAYSYLVVGAAGMGLAYGAKANVMNLLKTWNPTADVLALANIEVDLNTIPEGTTATLKWRGKPLFIKHRTSEEIETSANTPLSDLKDPEEDSARAKNPEWLVVIGVCTHLGCVPVSNSGDFGGWFCPCHGSHYDLAGRIRKGPAPLNLEIPPYVFASESTLVVGVDNM